MDGSIHQLPAFRAVEHHPHREILRERLEAVFDVRRNEERIARLKVGGFPITNEGSASGRDHIDLVPRMGRLRVVSLGGVVAQFQFAAPQDFRGEPSGRVGGLGGGGDWEMEV